MPAPLPHLAARIFNTPLAIHPGKAEIIVHALRDRLGVGQILAPGIQPAAYWGDYEDDAPASDAPLAYDLLEGVAIIPVEGTLVQRNGTIRPYSGMTGYDGIRNAVEQAWADDAVRAICLNIDSPGGEVAGCFDLADRIFAMRDAKPSIAILEEVAFSAAYALASACGRITVPRTGGAGSIGVIAMLADMSRALDRAGITVNIIQFGARKADGNPYQKLAPEARAAFQAQIDQLGTLFTDTVARNRDLTPDAVEDLQAASFLAGDALAHGLVDDIAAPDEAFAAFLSAL